MRFHQVLECSVTFHVFPLPSIGFYWLSTGFCPYLILSLSSLLFFSSQVLVPGYL